MIVIKLIHPNKGIGVVFEKKTSACFKDSIIQSLKHKYGKKFDECSVVIIETKKEKIKFLPTQQVFNSITIAAKKTKYTENQIQNHLDGNIPIKHQIMFKYYGKDKA
jgi:hypothetical protein